ncbi:MAG: FAD-dependent oxidoreductase [Alphaproteobacteria bacterium]|nr:FAD-dependent oxidoreductase [Alphaproteobacteria bacterium]
MPFDARAGQGGPSGPAPGRRIAIIGAGVAGLSAAWLLRERHEVVLYEADARLGGHANTVDAPGPNGAVIAVDAGFIVFNRPNYPNFTALAGHIGVGIDDTCMSFGASLDGGAVEYSGQSLASLFANPRAILDPAHWAMLRDLLRFNARAKTALKDGIRADMSVADFVAEAGLSRAFVERFLIPFAAAIWSAPSGTVLDYAASAFLRFFSNHGLLQVLNMPVWNTVRGGSRRYVEALASDLAGAVRASTPVVAIERSGAGVEIVDANGGRDTFDDAVVACHADDALKLIEAPTDAERQLLGAFRYQPNRAVVHADPSVMPTRRSAWSSWNYLGGGEGVAVTYWMNRLQNLGADAPDVFVSLNPSTPIDTARVIAAFDYAHPMFDVAAARAQRLLWSLQGVDRLWFCGAYFGQGFHEDGLQAGLAVAEALGGMRRPWTVENESGRIYLSAQVSTGRREEAAS